MTLFKKLLFLILTIAVGNTFAEELPAKISLYVDSSSSITIDKLLTTPEYFKPSKDRSLNLTFTDASLWVKIELPEHQTGVIVTIENAHLDYLNAYILDGSNEYRTFITGDLQKFSTRDVNSNLFSFLCQPGENTLFLRASTKGSLALPIRIHTLKEYFVYERINQSIIWLFLGIALVALSANLLFFFSLKDKHYLYYSLYVLASIIYAFTDIELSFQYLWPQLPNINKINLLLYSAPVFTLIFCNYFLELRNKIPVLFKLNKFIIAIQLFGGFYSLINYKVGAQICTYCFLLLPLIIFISTILVYLKERNKIVLLFLCAWFFYLIGILIYMLAVMNVFSYFSFLSNIVLLASSLEMVLVFVIVMFKVSAINEENIWNKSQLISLLTEKEKTLLEQYIFLEEKVNERTRDLQLKNEEIMSQNEEILCQNEELFLQRKQLEESNKTIDDAHQELTIYKNQLEETVQKRTFELYEANQVLDRKNQQLEQFAFMAAHNLRSPVAGIMGLSSLLESDDSVETQREVISRIQESVKKLDVIVKSMTGILSDPKMILQLFEKCDLYEILNESKSILEDEIAKSDTVIIANYDECYQLSSIKAYLHNLFYNMLSNAIKYRKPDKPVRIEVSSKRTGNDVAIIFKDFGIGIDMSKHGSDIFTPFKRFEKTVEGSGVGLYLIQTQIKTLGGTIQVESTLGEGTTFTIKLPNSALD